MYTLDSTVNLTLLSILKPEWHMSILYIHHLVFYAVLINGKLCTSVYIKKTYLWPCNPNPKPVSPLQYKTKLIYSILNVMNQTNCYYIQ